MPVKFVNDLQTKIATVGGIKSTDTTVDITAGDGAKISAAVNFSKGEWCYATLKDASGNREAVKITNVSGDKLTIVRGQDGDTARAWAQNDIMDFCLNKGGLEDLVKEIVAATLSNPTISSGGIVATETTAPATSANQAACYPKEADGVTEIFMRGESNGTETQVTQGGCTKIRGGVVDFSKSTDYPVTVGSGSNKTVIKDGLIELQQKSSSIPRFDFYNASGKVVWRAGYDYNSGQFGIWRTSDNGSNWTLSLLIKESDGKVDANQGFKIAGVEVIAAAAEINARCHSVPNTSSVKLSSTTALTADTDTDILTLAINGVHSGDVLLVSYSAVLADLATDDRMSGKFWVTTGGTATVTRVPDSGASNWLYTSHPATSKFANSDHIGFTFSSPTGFIYVTGAGNLELKLRGRSHYALSVLKDITWLQATFLKKAS